MKVFPPGTRVIAQGVGVTVGVEMVGEAGGEEGAESVIFPGSHSVTMSPATPSTAPTAANHFD